MADIKTHLRELSFCVQIGVLRDQLNINILHLTPKEFFDLAQKIVSNEINSASNIILSDFNNEQKQIIQNGIKLANRVFDCSQFNIKTLDEIFWLGNDTQKSDLIDVQVGRYGFSLKEESFILENMGLYKFVNLLTGLNYGKGLHIFMNFAPSEYERWFKYTWQLLHQSISINNFKYVKNDKYISRIEQKNNTILFSYQSDNKSILSELPQNLVNWSEFMEKTTPLIREKVFCKWINDVAAKDKQYIELKNHCANQAGNNLVNFILENLSEDGLARFLQIYEKSYYYAKITSQHINIFKVPALAEFLNEIQIDDIAYSVPKSQLNILTTIKNKQTQKSIVIRNECRFSHGQFNGTPEAKMYYARNSHLADIYTPIL